jgi:predicted nuclease with TOPRIM domain
LEIFGWIGTGLAALVAVGVITQFLRGSADKGTIASLERSNAALTTELAITNAKCDKLDTRVKALENENEVLRAAVTHSEEIRQIQTDVSELLNLVKGLAA